MSSVESKTEWDRESRVNRVEIIFFVSVLSFSLSSATSPEHKDLRRFQPTPHSTEWSPPISTHPSLHTDPFSRGLSVDSDLSVLVIIHIVSVLSWSLSWRRSLRRFQPTTQSTDLSAESIINQISLTPLSSVICLLFN